MENSLDHLEDLISRIPILQPLLPSLQGALGYMLETYQAGGKILICGNGGSAADAEHMTGELMKGFLLKRPLLQEERELLGEGGCTDEVASALQRCIPAISLVGGVALPTAYANDVDARAVFGQQVFGLGRKGDTLVAISTSGNSANVVFAARVAKGLGIKVVALTGMRESALSALADIVILAPSASTPRIQEYHLAIYHALCAEMERRLFEEDERTGA